MYILGISSYSHNSACALIKDGEIRIVVEEERLNREKHSDKFPEQSIEQCLAFEGLRIQDIDKITFFWIPSREIIGNFSHALKYFPQSINLLKTPSGGDDLNFFPRVLAMRSIGERIQKHFKLKKPPAVEFVEHHLGHAASAFFVSGFDEAAILTIDGRGESTSTMFATGYKNKIEKVKEIKVPHSLGHLYASLTHYLGFKPFFDEWKVMGMSAYGNDSLVTPFSKLVDLWGRGDYRLNLKYFSFHTHGQSRWLSDKFYKVFGSARLKDDPYEQRHFDLAYALQKLIEKAGVHLARGIHEETGQTNLCLTGGVVLNCLMNKKIIEETDFENIFIQPIANDVGSCLGSALYYYHHRLHNERRFKFNSLYLGTEFDNAQIEKVLSARKLHYKKSDRIAAETARYIADGKIVGWFQGRMEVGPRALGNRSITVNPMDPTMKERLNARVKRREFFRPFAPSVLEEKAFEYFDLPKGYLSPYMILVGEVKPEKRAVIPAVTHADNTARVHTVNRAVNPKYWELIHEFEKLTGVPVLLNTSFNENEPIVCTPEDAVNCFLRTEFDVLAIGDYLVLKN